MLSLLVGAVGGMDRLRFQQRNWPYLAVRGIVGSISMVLYLIAVMKLPLADAVRPQHCSHSLCDPAADVTSTAP